MIELNPPFEMTRLIVMSGYIARASDQVDAGWSWQISVVDISISGAALVE
jgi:hypothetical protein